MELRWIVGILIFLIVILFWSEAWLRSVWFSRLAIAALFALLALVLLSPVPAGERVLVIGISVAVCLGFAYVIAYKALLREPFAAGLDPRKLRRFIQEKEHPTLLERAVPLLPSVVIAVLLIMATYIGVCHVLG